MYTRDLVFATMAIEAEGSDLDAALQRLDKAIGQAGTNKNKVLMVTCLVASGKEGRESVETLVGWLGPTSPTPLVLESGCQGVFLLLRLVASR